MKPSLILLTALTVLVAALSASSRPSAAPASPSAEVALPLSALLSTGEDRAKALADWTWAGFSHERSARITVRTDDT